MYYSIVILQTVSSLLSFIIVKMLSCGIVYLSVPRGRYDAPCLPAHPDTPLCVDPNTSCQDNSFCLCTDDAFVRTATCGLYAILVCIFCILILPRVWIGTFKESGIIFLWKGAEVAFHLSNHGI